MDTLDGNKLIPVMVWRDPNLPSMEEYLVFAVRILPVETGRDEFAFFRHLFT